MSDQWGRTLECWTRSASFPAYLKEIWGYKRDLYCDGSWEKSPVSLGLARAARLRAILRFKLLLLVVSNMVNLDSTLGYPCRLFRSDFDCASVHCAGSGSGNGCRCQPKIVILGAETSWCLKSDLSLYANIVFVLKIRIACVTSFIAVLPKLTRLFASFFKSVILTKRRGFLNKSVSSYHTGKVINKTISSTVQKTFLQKFLVYSTSNLFTVKA